MQFEVGQKYDSVRETQEVLSSIKYLIKKQVVAIRQSSVFLFVLKFGGVGARTVR